jgi:SAM-dependent methyltransferase
LSFEAAPQVTGPDGLDLDYYHGYADRYEAVYAAGASTWEAVSPNEVLCAFLERYRPDPCQALDLGCGEGRDALFLAAKGFRVIGVDVAPAALAKARALAKDRGLADRCLFLERDVTYLRRVENRSVDLAINMGCLHMMPDAASRGRHLRRVQEVLKPSGLFLLAHCREKWLHGFFSVPDPSSIGPVIPGRVVPRRIRLSDDKTAMLPLPLVPYFEASEHHLVSEVERAGMRVRELLSETTSAFGNSVVVVAEPRTGK